MSTLNQEIGKNFRRRMEQAAAQQDWVLSTDRILMLLDEMIKFSKHAPEIFSSPSSAERSLFTTLYDEVMAFILEMEVGVEDCEQSHQELADWTTEHPENGVVQQVSGIRHTSSILRHLLSGLVGGAFILLLVSVLR
ncbi:hypothetical protein GGR55DRAFT_682416 [Xylaria sp. FL0064]|nr:hypothetical protein GGR55DRAFT_682416 [Xylaria sp. FL0064]